MKTTIARSLGSLAAALVITFGAGSASAAVCPGPDAYGYGCTDLTSCADVATPSCGLAVGDDVCQLRTVPFSFNYYGATYTQVGVASNGWIQMGSCADATDFSNDCPIPSINGVDNHISGVWDDLNSAAGGTICDGTSGTAPNRIYAVEYTNVPFFLSTATTTFQVQIHENGGPPNDAKIVVDIRNAAEVDYTSGLENLTATDGISRFCDNGTTGAQCTEYLAGVVVPPGSCDLGPVLDAIDLLEGKADLLEGKADVLGTNVNQLSVDVASIEAKVDMLGNNEPCDIFNLFVGVLIKADKVPTSHPCYVAPFTAPTAGSSRSR